MLDKYTPLRYIETIRYLKGVYSAKNGRDLVCKTTNFAGNQE